MGILRIRALLLICAMATVLACLMASCTAIPSSDNPDLRVSTSPDRSASIDLDGAELSTDFYVFVERQLVRSVAFYLDVPTTETPTRIERSPFFDLAGTDPNGLARPTLVASLDAGPHTLVAEVTYTTGEVETIEASFTVAASLPTFDSLTEQLDEGGRLTKQAALERFSVAVTALPGVVVPEVQRPFRVQLTGVFLGVLAYWDELTPEQRAVAGREMQIGVDPLASGVLDPPSAVARQGATAMASADAEPGDCDLGVTGDVVNHPSDIALADRLDARISSNTGRGITAPVIIIRNLTDRKANGRAAVAYTCPPLARPDGTASSFVIHLNPGAWQGGDGQRTWALAHELMHAFDWTRGTVADGDATGKMPWVAEGLTEWAGFELAAELGVSPADAGPTPAYWWQQWITVPAASLFVRSYSAVGFWALLQHIGTNMWPNVAGFYAAAQGTTSAFAYYTVKLKAPPTLDDVFASSFLNDLAIGPAWDLSGPLLADDLRYVPPTEPAIAAQALRLRRAEPYTADISLLSATPNVAVLSIEAVGVARTIDAIGREDVRFDRLNLCVSPDGCVCPPGLRARDTSLPAVAPVRLALTGGTDGATATVEGVSLLDWCIVDDQNDRGDASGDPHLRTFDRLRYDFQAAGEFVLTKSTVDDLQVQVRLQPLRSNVSIVTAAAAAVAGHRVAFTLTGPSLFDVRVAVDGVAQPVTATPASLPGGGTVRVERSQAKLTWPDGSVLTVHAAGIGSMRTHMYPSRARRGALVGLLGNADGDSSNDLAGRTGAAIPSSGFTRDQLYGSFGDSWRITQAESLFDYAPGQSTASFTDLAFPRELVSIDQYSAADQLAAEKVCRSRGITDPRILGSCILDILLSGESAFADSAAAEEALDHAGGLIIDGPPATVTIDEPGSSAGLEFTGVAGQRIAVQVPFTSFPRFGCGTPSPGNSNPGTFRLLDPDGFPIPNAATCTLGAGDFVDPVTLPRTGTYRVVADPGPDGTGTALIRVLTVTDQTGTIIVGGPPVPVSLTSPGGQVRLSFTVPAAGKVTVVLTESAVPTSPFNSERCAEFYASNGEGVGYGCIGNGFDVTLPRAGTYELRIDPFLDELPSVGSVQISAAG